MHDALPTAGARRVTSRDVWFALGGLLAFQLVAMVRLRNAAFVDEATYIVAGRTMLERIARGDFGAAPFSSYFSGAPYLQPIWAAWLDARGGLELARALSAGCLSLATLALALGVARVRGWLVGLAAALAFTAQGTVQFVGHLSTPDAPALFLLALALALAFTASERWALASAIAVGVLAGVAGAIKYGAMAYAPPVALILAIQLWERGARERAVIALMLSAIAGASVLWLLLRLDGGALFEAVWFTTLNRPFSEGKDPLTVAGQLLEYGGLLGVLAVYGLSQRRYSLALSVPLLLGVFIAPLQHLRLGETVSLHKHLAFSALFAAPLVGVALVRMNEGIRESVRFRGRDPRSVLWVLAVGSLLTLLVFPGLAQAGALYGAWPQETPRVYRAVAQGVDRNVRILTEEAELGGYYGGRLAPSQWVSPHVPYRAADGREVPPDSAVVVALREGAFDRIVLRFDHSHTWSETITPLLERDPRYVVRETVRYRLPGEDGAFVVWERRAP